MKVLGIKTGHLPPILCFGTDESKFVSIVNNYADGGITQHILNMGTRWRWVISLKLHFAGFCHEPDESSPHSLTPFL